MVDSWLVVHHQQEGPINVSFEGPTRATRRRPLFAPCSWTERHVASRGRPARAGGGGTAPDRELARACTRATRPIRAAARGLRWQKAQSIRRCADTVAAYGRDILPSVKWVMKKLEQVRLPAPTMHAARRACLRVAAPTLHPPTPPSAAALHRHRAARAARARWSRVAPLAGRGTGRGCAEAAQGQDQGGGRRHDEEDSRRARRRRGRRRR